MPLTGATGPSKLRARWAVLAVCLALGALGVAALASRPAPAAPFVPPNILLFTVDTVRADHLSSYGYARDTSPAIDALAARGTRFERAYATSGWTAPSLTSIMTGVLPSEHGVTHARLGEGTSLEQEMLSPELPVLAETLRAAGYRTVGVASNGHVARSLGFARGFDDYECLAYLDLPDLRRAVSVHVAAMRAAGRPFFLWVHVLDPHAPYRPTPPSFERFWPADRPRYPAFDSVIFPELMELMTAEIRAPHALEYIEAAYDSEIATTDAYFEELVRELAEPNLAIVVTADHGEEFEDHWRMAHGHTLYEEAIHVPMIIALPGAAEASVVTTPVSLVDLFPTIAELAGTEAPAGLAGRSLVPLMRGEPAAPRPIYAETELWESARAIVDGDLKLIVSDEPAAETLFDLAADPRERVDLASGAPERVAGLRARLDEALAEARARRPELTVMRYDVADEERARLRALGYAP